MPRRVFTPSAVKIIRESAAQGKTSAEIADLINSTAASVRVKCCQLKISLSRRGRPYLTCFGREKLVLHMHPADYAALKRKAGHMQKPASELAALLLGEIVNSNLYEAVLDDGKRSLP
jgi:hypothetical protein